MVNQILLWSLCIVPWFTLLLMKRYYVKRYIPTAFLCTIVSIIFVEIGITLNWWSVKETAYPLRTASYIFGLNPVMLIWILRYTFRRFWLFLAVEIAANLAFSYLYLGYFLFIRNIYQYTTLGPIHVFIMTTVSAILFYLFQIWEEGIYARSYNKI